MKKKSWRTGVAVLGLVLMTCNAVALFFDIRIDSLRIPKLPSFDAKSSKFVVVLDPGHGGHDTGAKAQGLVEKDLNLDLAKAVRYLLTSHQISVQLTRDDDTFLPLSERTRYANGFRRCLFVSIHFNFSKGTSGEGIETYYSEGNSGGTEWVRTLISGGSNSNDDSRLLADSVQKSLITETKALDRGIKERGLYVIRNSKHPAVLIEGGFLNNPKEAEKIRQKSYQKQLASAIADGIINYMSSHRDD